MHDHNFIARYNHNDPNNYFVRKYDDHDPGTNHHHHEIHDEATLYHDHSGIPDHGHEWVTAIHDNGDGNFDHDIDYYGPADHNHDKPATTEHVHDWRPFYAGPNATAGNPDYHCDRCGSYRIVTASTYQKT